MAPHLVRLNGAVMETDSRCALGAHFVAVRCSAPSRTDRRPIGAPKNVMRTNRRPLANSYRMFVSSGPAACGECSARRQMRSAPSVVHCHDGILGTKRKRIIKRWTPGAAKRSFFPSESYRRRRSRIVGKIEKCFPHFRPAFLFISAWEIYHER